MKIQCADLVLDISRPVIMGILNATPDSFSDGGQYFSAAKKSVNKKNPTAKNNIDLALARAEQMIREGANIIDVGGESTRPGASPVSLEEELNRVVPVVEAIRKHFDIIVSVDTSTPQVMEESANVGAGIINDVRALQRENAVTTAAKTGLPICLMHMQGQPDNMQKNPSYEHVVDDVKTFLLERIAACEAAGIERDRLLIDPGFGFGKSLDHNLELLKRLRELESLDCPIVVGLSRKSMIANLLKLNATLTLNGTLESDGMLEKSPQAASKPISIENERLIGSVSLALMAAQRGASIIRVHDVAATREALQILHAINDNPPPL